MELSEFKKKVGLELTKAYINTGDPSFKLELGSLIKELKGLRTRGLVPYCIKLAIIGSKYNYKPLVKLANDILEEIKGDQ